MRGTKRRVASKRRRPVAAVGRRRPEEATTDDPGLRSEGRAEQSPKRCWYSRASDHPLRPFAAYAANHPSQKRAMFRLNPADSFNPRSFVDAILAHGVAHGTIYPPSLNCCTWTSRHKSVAF